MPVLGPGPERPPEVGAFEACKEVLDTLRSKHPSTGSALEVLLTELGQKFTPRTEERLLAVVHALLHRCYKTPLSGAADVPPGMKKELAGVFEGARVPMQASVLWHVRVSFLGLDATVRMSKVQQQRPATSWCIAISGVCQACFKDGSSRSGRLALHHQEQFLRDLSPDSPTFPQTLGHLTESLKVRRWRSTQISTW